MFTTANLTQRTQRYAEIAERSVMQYTFDKLLSANKISDGVMFRMKFLSLNRRFVALLVLVFPAILLMNLVAFAQDGDKSLNIERYGDEPLQLVGLKIGSQSITDNLARHNPAGVDTITFNQRDGWFRNVEFKLRNISGKPIYGVSSHLFFRPSETKTVYRLPLTGLTQAGQGVLEPEDEITLIVTEQAWKLTKEILKYYDVDPDKTVVSFGVDVVQFSDNEQWSKGRMLRLDPPH